ncbi:hypothetical protein OLMES_2435 [Oleiphilus messinensis]|uniref:Uncharacterized protein n=1 Tax=Oleiphilus messinensis TaxID=141451 RepID=A0A1Y0I9Q6_9GAMM|nr:hypothetical protein [Oleiphilus messinensis]ARU56496.1 hypothetical protein OLMES_2435 [Oleiphilus messinensis]
MLKDAASPLSRDDTELTMMQSYFPYLKQKVESVGYLVSEDVESIVFIPKIGDASLLAGVHIIDKSVTIFRDATENDSYFKIVGTP